MVVLLVSAKGSDGSEAEELLGGPLVRLRDVDHRALLVVLAAAARGGRGRERGAGLASGLHPAQLAGAGQLEPLLRTRVRLHLGHGVSLPVLRVVGGAAQASISGFDLWVEVLGATAFLLLRHRVAGVVGRTLLALQGLVGRTLSHSGLLLGGELDLGLGLLA